MPTHEPIRVLELRSVWGTGGGPEKTILRGAVHSDPRRFAVTVCYIRDARDPGFNIGRRAASLGIDYVEIIERHSFDTRIWSALRDLVVSRRIDIVHAHEHKTDLLALLLARATGVIPLATAHGWSGLSRKEQWYYVADRWLLARYPIVVAVSEPIRQTLIAAGATPENVRCIRNGIDHVEVRANPGVRSRVRQELGIAPERKVVGAVGRLEEVKRFDLLLSAVATLPEPARPMVVIAGEGPLRSELEAHVRQLGIERDVLLLGHRDDPIHVHQAFDVYVQTSSSEGIPNAVLEAMALETPVVATNVGGTSQLITDTVHGLLVPSGSIPAIASAIRATLEDQSAARARTRAARARVEQELSFDARMSALERIYDELMARRLAPLMSRSRVHV